MDAERQKIINDAARISNDIKQMFVDAKYWNELHPNEEPIDPDPDGELGRWKRRMDSLLTSENAKGNHPSVVPIKARPRRYIPMTVEGAMRSGFLEGEAKN